MSGCQKIIASSVRSAPVSLGNSREGWPVDRFACPDCRAELTCVAPQSGSERLLKCSACERTYPVKGGVYRFVEDEAYTSSFGRQWTRFHVVRPDEDRAVFTAKTGVRPEDLRGLDVLDAGCGGGRYSRLVADAGAWVIGIDRSRAIDKAAAVCKGLPNAVFAQGDLLRLPFKDGVFDFVFSIGVIHHSVSPRRAFAELARVVKPGGRLAVWVYRRNTWIQERLNDLLRGLACRMDTATLEGVCRALGVLGRIPVVRVTLNKVFNFSNHPDPELRVCDNFDWYACQYQYHHTEDEVLSWFEQEGFSDLRILPPMRKGRLYTWAYQRNLIIGSGVNIVGRKNNT